MAGAAGGTAAASTASGSGEDAGAASGGGVPSSSCSAGGVSGEADPAELERDLTGVLREAFGFEIAVMVRTRDELAEVVATDPFAGVADDPARYQVSFLSAKPDPAGVAELKAVDIAPERVAVRGREVYAWHPGGVGRSELAKLITARRLGVEVTARNWRTVNKILEF